MNLAGAPDPCLASIEQRKWEESRPHVMVYLTEPSMTTSPVIPELPEFPYALF